MADDLFIVLGAWTGYLALAAVSIWAISRIARKASNRLVRVALVSLVISAFFAPSVVGGGHGGGVGPAWMALFQMYPLRLGVLPMLVTFGICFVIGTTTSRRGERNT